MKAKVILPIMILLSFMVGILPVYAQTGATSHYVFRGYSADGEALGGNESVAIQLYIQVLSGDFRLTTGGRHSGTMGFLNGSIAFAGGNTLWGDAYFDVPELLLVTGDALETASFEATLTFSYQDGQGNTGEMPISLNLTWTATDLPSREISNSTRFLPPWIEHWRYRGESRWANCGGTITFNGITYDVNNSWGPCAISKVNTGSVDVMH